MARVSCHQLAGGYKAYREAALNAFAAPLKLQVVGGYTGSGKSEVLRALRDKGEQIIDLESLANHKGSAFGGLMMPPQPTTEQFQNEIFEQLLRLDLSRRIWIEDESISIGKVVLPHVFWRQITSATVYELSLDKVARIERLVREYGDADREQFLQAMVNITKKLGGQNFKEAKQKLLAGDMAATIEILLYYYDKAYGTGLRGKQNRIRATVSWEGHDADQAATALMAAAT